MIQSQYADFDTVAARQACVQLHAVFTDCGYPTHTVTMQVNASDADASVLVTWTYKGPVIDGKRWKLFRAATFRECFIAATKWIAANARVGERARA